MILFQTDNNDFYNALLYGFIVQELDEVHDDVGVIIDKLMPKYLRREQYKNCEQAFNDLLNWSGDNFNHNLAPIHQLTLFKFLQYVFNKTKGISNFFDDYFAFELECIIINSLDYSIDFKSLNKLVKEFINFYSDKLFTNLEFLKVEELYLQDKLENYLECNSYFLNMYYEILPFKIQEKFIKNDVDIFFEIEDLLNFIQKAINKGNMAFMFWENSQMMKESKIQIVLENIIDAYFYNHDIDITREALVGSGRIDFKFYKNNNEKVLFEIKKASSTYLKLGYERQLIQYMKSWNCQKAYYIIMCFTDDDIAKAQNFDINKKQTDFLHKDVDVVILDVRIKNRKLKSINKLKMDNNVSKKIDNYFEHILNINNLSSPQEIINYLNLLRGNFYKLNNENLKKEYLVKLQDVCSEKMNCNIIPWGDSFYKINTKQDALITSLMTILRSVKFEKDLDIVIDSLVYFYSNLTEDGNFVLSVEITEMLEFLKENHPKFYRIFSSYYIEMYLLNYSSLDTRSFILQGGPKYYHFVCLGQCNDEKAVSGPPVYEFFYLCGQFLWDVAIKKGLSDESFFEYMDINNFDIEQKNILFADHFAMYLAHNSEFSKYSPFEFLPEDIFNKINCYFSGFIDKLGGIV